MVANTTGFPRWALMWAMSAVIYAAFKLQSYREAAVVGAGAKRSVAYLFFWPGMDAREFFNRRCTPPPIPATQWAGAVAKLLLGTFLLWFVVRRIPASADLVRGWVAMVGIILVLHFGTFHLLALFFQQANINAQPLMNAPLCSRSVAEFWGKRWNVAFNHLANRLIFRKVVGQIGVGSAVLLTFLCSGLIHDVVISIPAGAGYGLPTAYFVIQGIAVLFEHSHAGAAIGLGNGIFGRIFTIAVTAGPAFWLFHPPFIRNVILPFLRAIGCL
jgi:hypothetical protein